MKRFYIDKVWIDDTCLWIETKDGRKVCTPFSKWKRLENATKAQRDDFILGYTGIHWPSLDEDLGYEGLFVDAGLCEATPEVSNNFNFGAALSLVLMILILICMAFMNKFSSTEDVGGGMVL